MSDYLKKSIKEFGTYVMYTSCQTYKLFNS